jgi:hypothetical protein
MPRVLYISLFALALVLHLNPVAADESKELKKQRQAAQKERQAQKNERTTEINENTRAFREFTRDLKLNYQGQVKELDTEFELQRVELKADHDVRVVGAEAEYQKKLSSLFMKPGIEFNEQTIEQLQSEGKHFSDELFALRKQSAGEVFRANIGKEERKNALLTEQDQMALEEASSLGLTGKYPPILATAIGDGLTKQEARWNEREEKEVAKLEVRNRKTVSEFRNGAKLRKWEIENLHEDFKLTWDEKAALHALDSEQIFYNAMFMQAAQGGQVDQETLITKMAEINEQKKLINIEYRKTRDRLRIKRREEKKRLASAN